MRRSSISRWGHSQRDQRVHAFGGEQWGGDEIALCQHACPPQRVSYTFTDEARVCRTCRTRVRP